MYKKSKYSAKSKVYDGITFKSILEMNAYKRMKAAGLNPKYEFHKYPLFEGFYPTKPFYAPNKQKHLEIKMTQKKKLAKVLDITYTPDFCFYRNGYFVIIETKGFKTHDYRDKIKLFRKSMEEMGDVIFFEVHSMKQLDEAIEIINKL